MRKKIVFYSTPLGYGHLARDLAISSSFPKKTEAYILTSLSSRLSSPNAKLIKLPPINGYRRLNDPVEFVPFQEGMEDKGEFAAHITSYLQHLNQIKPDVVVVDIAAEMAVLSKLAGYKTALMYISGKKTDQRNLLAYTCVDKILVPYPEGFTDVSYLEQNHLKKFAYSGGFSRLDKHERLEKKVAKKRLGLKETDTLILSAVGRGGNGEKLLSVFKEAVAQLPNVKAVEIARQKEEEIVILLSAAEIAVTGTGDNTVMEMCRFGVPFITTPLDRYYGEQKTKADDLERIGACLVIPPDKLTAQELTKEITKLMNDESLRSRMAKAQKKLVSGEGGVKMAEIILSMG